MLFVNRCFRITREKRLGSSFFFSPVFLDRYNNITCSITKNDFKNEILRVGVFFSQVNFLLGFHNDVCITSNTHGLESKTFAYN